MGISTEEEKKVTEPITARIEKEILDRLRQEARGNEQSLNSLITLIFKHHVDWHTNATKAGFVTVRRALILRTLEKLTEKDVIDIAVYIGKNEARSFIFLLRNEYNITSAIDVFETWIKISGYPYRHDVHYGKHSFVIHHEMGKKWSIYLLEQDRVVFEEFGIKIYDTELDNNMLAFKFDLH